MYEYPEFQEQLEKFQVDGSNIDYFTSYVNTNLRAKPDDIKKLLEQLLSISEKNDFKIPLAHCLNYLGWYYHDMSNYDMALEYHTKANNIFSEVGVDEGNILTCNALLADYSQLGLYDLGLEWGLNGINLAEKTDNKSLLVPLLLNTGTSYIQLKYYKEARELYNQLKAVNYTLSRENTIIINQAMSELELYTGNIEKSLKYANKAYEISNASGLDSMTSEVIRILAQIDVEYKKYDQAEEKFKRAAEMSLAVGEVSVYCGALIAWGQFHSSTSKLESAREKLEEAVKVSEEIKLKPLTIEAYKELGNVYKKLNNYEKALECMDKYEACEKEIFNKQSSTWIARMQESQLKREAEVYKTLYDQIGRISTIGQKITSDLNLDNILDTIYSEVKHLVAADIFGIAIYNEEDKNLDYALFIEKGQRINMGYVSIDDKASFGTYCVRNKTDIMINDIENEYRNYLTGVTIVESQKTKPKSLIYCPLKLGTKVTGFINLQSYNKNAYNVNDLNTLRILASYVAIALENAALFKEIEYSAAHDYLTGLLNRREIFREGEEAFERFLRYNEDICVVMIDIDDFKRVNDTYGHSAGDEVIKKVAEVIRGTIRKTDFAGRYGGEEFLVVMAHSDIKMAMELAERVRKTIEACKIKYNSSEEIGITLSLGVYQYMKGNKSFDEGVDFADNALYEAKGLGKNKVVSYTKAF
jgi:diguanylate cyclase (GGDEF)-like protein